MLNTHNVATGVLEANPALKAVCTAAAEGTREVAVLNNGSGRHADDGMT